MESLLLPLLTEEIALADHQHGFRKQHSTVTALHHISVQISTGLNQRLPCERSVLAALDLSKAFDTVDHDILLNDILETSIPGQIKRWLYNYLKGRQTYVEFRNTKSRYCRQKQGVPQGGVISPLLFNLYLSKIPQPPPGITLISYADDCTLITTGNNIEELNNSMNHYLHSLNTWLEHRRLILSTEKSTVSLLTSWTLEMNQELNININGKRLATTKNPKSLGLTFDQSLNFNVHISATINKLKNRNNMMKALAGTNWGKEKGDNANRL